MVTGRLWGLESPESPALHYQVRVILEGPSKLRLSFTTCKMGLHLKGKLLP